MISQFFYPSKTRKFFSYEKIPHQNYLTNPILESSLQTLHPFTWFISIDWNCDYTKNIILTTIQRRNKYCRLINDITDDPILNEFQRQFQRRPLILQFSDFENIQWEYVLSERTMASSYLIRKGLSRKAQMSLQLQRFMKKSVNSVLHRSIPETHIIETWDIFPDNANTTSASTSSSFLGQGFAFDLPHLHDWNRVSVREKLRWQFTNNIELLFLNTPENKVQETNQVWILKPSVTNKGADISIIQNYDELLEKLEDEPSIREWVLQRYIRNPLLLQKKRHKFHFRVYIVCIGALQVFLFEEILILFAAHSYRPEDYDDIYSHLTNTARAAETVNFDEQKFVKTIRDLPSMLMEDYPNKFPTKKDSEDKVKQIIQQMKEIVHDLFQSYENEYSVFTPMTNCFELFGLDFMIDEDFQLSFLECNPGPDFKQTGERLSRIIEHLFESIFRLIVDYSVAFTLPQSPSQSSINLFSEEYKVEEMNNFLSAWIPSLSLVYSKPWSVNQLKSNMTLID